MTIEELLTELFGDELSDMFIGNQHSVNETRGKILPLLNTAMNYAYARWKCKYDSEFINVVEGTHFYTLAGTDILQVTQLVNVYGLDVPTFEYQVLGQEIYFPDPATQTLEVVYKVKHTPYTTAQVDSTVALELPDMLVPWLKAYVSHRYFASMKTEEALQKSADFLAQAMLAENMYVQTNTTNEFTAPANTKLASRGFA